MTGLWELFRNIDYTSPEPKILISSKRRHQTSLGGLLSLLAFALITISGTYFIYDYIFQPKMTVVENTQTNIKPRLNLSDTPIMVFMQNSYSIPISPRAWSVKFIFWSSEPVTFPNGTKTMNTTNYVIDPVKCDEAYFGSYWELFRDIPFLDNYACIPRGLYNLSLYGTYGDTQPHSLLGVYLNKCMNDSAINKTDCYSELDIVKNLRYSYINFKYLDYQTFHYNSDPRSPYVFSTAIPVSINIFKREFFYLSSIKYKADDNIFFRKYKEISYYGTHQRSSYIDFDKKGFFPGSFSCISLVMSNEKKFYQRNYSKIQHILADIGGFTRLIKIFVNLCNEYFYANFYYLKLISSYFTFKDLDSNIESRNNNKKFSSHHDKINREYYSNSSFLNNSRGKGINDFDNIDKIEKTEKMEKQMNCLHTENKTTLITTPIPKKKPKLKLNCCSYIFPFIKTKNVKIFKILVKSINKKISIDYIIKKLKEVDKLKLVLLNQNQLGIFNSIPYKVLYLKNNNFVDIGFNTDNRTTKIKHNDMDAGSEYNVDDYHSYNDQVMESYNIVKNSLEKSEIDKKLLNMIDEVK